MKRIGIIAGVFVAVALLIVIGLSFLLDAHRFKPDLESELSKVLGRHVTVGELKFSILAGSVSAGDLTISDDPGFGSTPFLKAKSLNVGAELIPLAISATFTAWHAEQFSYATTVAKRSKKPVEP